MFENHSLFLNQLKTKGIKVVNIGPEDLVNGDKKVTRPRDPK